MVFHKMIPVFSGKIKVVKRYKNTCTCNYISKLVFLWCNETGNTGFNHSIPTTETWYLPEEKSALGKPYRLSW
jgi:hypothetical protein